MTQETGFSSYFENGVLIKEATIGTFSFGTPAAKENLHPSVHLDRPEIDTVIMTGSTAKVGPQDPTKTFSFDDTHSIAVEEGFLAAASQLRERSMIVISCDLHVAAMSGARHLTQYLKDEPSSSVRCYSSIDSASRGDAGSSSAEKGGNPYFTFDRLLSNIDAIPNGSTILIDLTTERRAEDAASFMDPFLDEETQDNYFIKLSSLLSGNRLRVIFLVPSAIGARNIPQSRVYVWCLDPIKTLLAHHFPQECDELLRILRSQIEKGDWGSHPLDGIWNAIKEGNLRARISGYEGYTPQERRNEEREFVALLAQDDPDAPLSEAALFAAVYFPKLSEPHFERVLEVLLGDDVLGPGRQSLPSGEKSASKRGADQGNAAVSFPADGGDTISVSIGSDTVTIQRDAVEKRPAPELSSRTAEQDEMNPGLAQQGLTRDVTGTRLIDLWHLGARKRIPGKCKIELITDADGRKFIGFSAPHLSTLARSALEQAAPFHFTEYFQRVLDSGLLFHHSVYLSDSTLELIREGMLRTPDEYDWEWLSLRIIKALAILEFIDQQDAETVPQLLAQLTIKAQKSLVMARWSKLLRMLLGHVRLAKVAKDLLTNLMDAAKHELVLEFVRRLRTAPGLDVMHWLKRLIGEGNYPEIREHSIEFLVGYLKSNYNKNPELVSSLRGWVPKGEPRPSLHPLQEAAVRVPLEVSVRELIEQDLAADRLPQTVFPILSGQDMPKMPSWVAETMSLLLYPPIQAPPRHLETTLILLMAMADFLSGDVWFVAAEESTTSTDGKSHTTWVSVIALVLNNLLTEDTAYDGLIALLLTGWVWLLSAPTLAENERTKATHVIENISDLVVQHLPARLDSIRTILNEMRRRVADTRPMLNLSGRRNRNHLSTFITMSRGASDALYRSRKRASSSTLNS